MAKRIGIVQTQGIGDIIIALPIADHFIELGCEIVWPVDEDFVRVFEPVKPEVTFLPVAKGPDYFLNEPLKLIKGSGCERTIILYSYLSEAPVYDPRLSSVLKFDEYKYAIAGVPFAKKWDLKIERDLDREQRLFDSLGVQGDYVCFHGLSSDMSEALTMPDHMADGLQVVEMTKRRDDESPFDWILTLERAKKLVLIDSCFANLAEQLNLPNAKSLIADNNVSHTPVFKNGWQYVFPDAFRREE